MYTQGPKFASLAQIFTKSYEIFRGASQIIALWNNWRFKDQKWLLMTSSGTSKVDYFWLFLLCQPVLPYKRV